MDLLFRYSKEQNKEIEIIYISGKGVISQRKVVIKEIQSGHVIAYCFLKQKPRIFKKENILSAAKVKTKRGVLYA